ncbi:hypothetical protein F7R06_22685 [Pseudomonas moorei]|nr:hypothetical protein F7R06_22685 [Pseudomonas moorei]
MWRGSSLPLGCEAAPTPVIGLCLTEPVDWCSTAAHSSRTNLPRHRNQKKPDSWRFTIFSPSPTTV